MRPPVECGIHREDRLGEQYSAQGDPPAPMPAIRGTDDGTETVVKAQAATTRRPIGRRAGQVLQTHF
jgi:hypothetical protein